MKEKAANAFEFWRESLVRRLNEGIQNGEINPDININEFVSVFISLMQGGVMQSKVTGNITSLNRTMDFLERMIKNLKK
jgi:TetR/AcrR family transcriptional regulator, transcriptional repressor for nem operon